MEYLTLQIFTTITFFIGESLLIFKKKSGWVWRQIGLALLVIINYLMGLYLLIIPTVASMVIGFFAYLKWQKDDKKKQQEKLVKSMVRFAKVTELCVIHGLVRSTPAVEVKKMKLRQIEKDIDALVIKKEKKKC